MLTGPASSARIWLRVDLKDREIGFFDNMQDRDPGQLPEWTELSITGKVAEDAEAVAFGLLFIGERESWIDGAVIEIVE